jgi:hypothetical protein
MGRPLKQISAHDVELLASVFCTQQEIAEKLGCSVDTLMRRFAESYKKGLADAKTSLRRHQFMLAKKNAAMAIFLGKNYLGQRDTVNLDVRELDAEIERELALLGSREEAETPGPTASESIN